MKKCPFCSEEIQDDAKKCRYCNEWLEGVVADIKKKITPQKISSSWSKFRKFFIKSIIIIIILFFLGFIGNEIGEMIGKSGITVEENKTKQGDEVVSKESECLKLHPLASVNMTVFLSGKESSERIFKENKCTENDLNVDYKKTEMSNRVDNCRRAKRSIDTYDYNQCLKEKGL